MKDLLFVALVNKLWQKAEMFTYLWRSVKFNDNINITNVKGMIKFLHQRQTNSLNLENSSFAVRRSINLFAKHIAEIPSLKKITSFGMQSKHFGPIIFEQAHNAFSKYKVKERK